MRGTPIEMYTAVPCAAKKEILLPVQAREARININLRRGLWEVSAQRRYLLYLSCYIVDG